MKTFKRRMMMFFALCCTLSFFGGCAGRDLAPSALGGGEEGYWASLLVGVGPEDIGDLSEKLSPARKESLIRENLKEKYISGVSYPYEYVYLHHYSLTKKDGSSVAYTDYAVRVNTADALKGLGEQIFPYCVSKEMVEILKASVYSPDGRQISTDVTSVREKEPFTGLVYSDLKVKSLSLKSLVEGSILRMVIKQSERPTGRKKPIFKEIALDNYVPVKEKVYVLRFEAATKYVTKERIRAEAAGKIGARKYIAVNGDTVLVYTHIGGRTEILESGSIPWQEFDSRVFFHTPATWDEVARSYYSLSNPKVTVTQEISQKVNLLTKDLQSREKKIKAIYDYVRGIRYVAILLNQHEVIPHEASLTFRNGYGDCKDKSVLLMVMLKAAGIDSSIALVNTLHLIDKSISSLYIFNHAIVAFRNENGSYSFVDATTPYVPYGLLPLVVQNRHALIVGEKGGELVVIPPQAPEQNRVEETIQVEFHDVESATIRTRSLTTSSNEFYHMLPNFPEDVLRKYLQRLLSTKYREIEIIDLKCDPADQQGLLVIEKKLKIKDFAKRMGNAYGFNPLVDADTPQNHDVVALEERKREIELEGPKSLIADITIRVPNSVAVDYVPKAKSLKNEKFGEYIYKIRHADGLIQVHRELRIHVKRISVEDYAEFRTFCRECIRQEEEIVLLRKK